MRKIFLDFEKIRLKEAFLFTLGFALMVVGILHPEAKNTIGEVPWTWIFILPALPIFVQSIILDQSTRSVIFVYFLTITGVGVWVIFSAVVDPGYMIHTMYLSEVIPILFLTVPLSATLFNLIEKRNLFLMLDWAALILCLMLFIVRTVQQDFSREGFFLGLGPLTFIKYVGLGFIVRTLVLKKFNIIPFILYGIAFYVADSKGPVLFIAVTFIVVALSDSIKTLLKLAPLLILIIGGLSQNARIQSLISDITAVDLTTQITLSDQQIANEEISGTLVRLGAISISIDLIRDDPIFGVGPGSWPVVTNLPSLKYPHNIILEVWSEMGVVVFILVVGVFARVAFAVRQIHYMEHAIPAIFAFLTATTSGSLPDFRFFLIFFLLLMFVKRSSVQSGSYNR